MFTGKKILVIGGTGTIGQALVKRIASDMPDTIRVYSRDEYKQFMMQEELREYNNIRFLIGDVRDKERLDRAMKDIDIVYSLAAMKHVPACEYNPFESVKTNVIGTQNVIDCAIRNKVKKVVYTSSDKAVSPSNTMGATKLLAERLISSADFSKGGATPVFAAVRFGNVLGSRGSVIPLWQNQIKNKHCVTITNPEMTRFMMSISQAVELVIEASKLAKGGEVFVLKMPVIRIGDLADVVIESQCHVLGKKPDDIDKRIIGLRSGEKIYEELMTEQESASAIEYDNMFAIIPYHKISMLDSNGVKRAQIREYSSHNETPVSKDSLKILLKDINII